MKRKNEDTGTDFVKAAGTAFEIVKTLGNAVVDGGGEMDDLRMIIGDGELSRRIARQLKFATVFEVTDGFKTVDADTETPREQLIRSVPGLDFIDQSCFPRTPFASGVPGRSLCAVVTVKETIGVDDAIFLLRENGMMPVEEAEFFSALIQHPSLAKIGGLCSPHAQLSVHIRYSMSAGRSEKAGYVRLAYQDDEGYEPLRVDVVERNNRSEFTPKDYILVRHQK